MLRERHTTGEMHFPLLFFTLSSLAEAALRSGSRRKHRYVKRWDEIPVERVTLADRDEALRLHPEGRVSVVHPLLLPRASAQLAVTSALQCPPYPS